MRPVRDLFIEEYWNIAFREYTEDDSVVDVKDGKTEFRILKAGKRFWYADPFLFEHNGKTWLFVEAFDNMTETGCIACSEYVCGQFLQPKIVLKEKFHLSYPYVFEKDGKIYMMPETHEDKCIQLYEAVDFPKKWEKKEILVRDVDAVDTVIENGMLVASVICPENDMSVDLALFDTDGNGMPYSPVYTHSLEKRGAGRIFSHRGQRIRPAQGCKNNVYGGKIIFNRIDKCDKDGYSEEAVSELTPGNISVPIKGIPRGIHTYARTDKLEIVDIKFERYNLPRLYWILQRKL